jgi:hypothetical protein
MELLMDKLDDVYRIANFIDTFALGHYARVLDATDLRGNTMVAFKVMRAEHLTPGKEPRGNTAPLPTRPTS